MSLEANNPASPAPMEARRRRYSDEPAAAASVSSAYAHGAAAPHVQFEWNGIFGVLAVALVVAGVLYSTALQELYNKWSSDSGWSHGFVVPLISLFFVRLKWDTLRTLAPQGTWLGLLVMLVGIGGQLSFRVTGLSHMSAVSFLVVLVGLVLLVFGKEFLKILWLPIAYLAFAVPPPESLYVQMTTPMQVVAAEFGVQLLPLFGCEATRHGTIIDVSHNGMTSTLNVEQACSGMRMLVAFFALAVALAYSTPRPVWQKLTLAGFALPIAIFCNGVRVALTGVLAVRVGGQWAEGKAHEYFGLLMLGPAMMMQLGIAWILDRLFVEVPDDSKGGDA